MANYISGRIEMIGQTQQIASKKQGGQTLIKREFVIRALRFNPEDGTPELSQYNTPIFEINGQDNVGVLDQYKVGECVKVQFSLEGTSIVDEQTKQTKYFNRVRAYRIERLNVSLPQMQQPAQQTAQAPQGQQQVDYSQYQGAGAKPF